MTSPRSTRARSSGVAPTIPSTWNVQHVGYSRASGARIARTSMGPSACASTARARTTLSTIPASMREIAAATATPHAASSPSSTSTAPRGLTGCAPASESARSGAEIVAGSEIEVSHERPSRVPRTYRGTMRTPPEAEASAKAKEPKATRPEPRSPTSSRTIAREETSDHHARASAIREGPDDSKRAASPHATIPSPRRTHETPGVGIAAMRSPGCATSSVLTTHGSRSLAACTLTPPA